MALYLPTGYVFCPNDKELLVDYLKTKTEGRALPADIITTIDVYSLSPDQLPPNKSKYLRDNVWYFFTTRRTHDIMPTAAKNGYYAVTNDEPAPVFHKNELVGFRTELSFYEGQFPSTEKETNWVVYEYCVAVDKAEHEYPEKVPNFVVCKICRLTEEEGEVDE